MIDVWWAKAWVKAGPRFRETGGFLKRLGARRTGLVLTFAMPLVVFGLHRAALTTKPRHLDEIIGELGVTRRFIGNPWPDHSGTRLVFASTTEKGYGLYLYDLATGKRRLIHQEIIRTADELINPERLFHDWALIGWSPDDKYFAFGIPEQLVIVDGATAAVAATIPVKSLVTAGAWLQSGVLVLEDQERVLYNVHQIKRRWSEPEPFKYFRRSLHNKVQDVRLRNLTACGKNAVVWQQGNAIWRCPEEGNGPARLWDAGAATLIEFSYTEEAKKFLVHCLDAKGHFVAEFDPGKHKRLVNLIRIKQGQNPVGVAQINDGTGYAYVNSTGQMQDTVVIQSSPTNTPLEYQWQARVKGFAAGQHEVFVTSSLHDEPPGIWKCDLDSSRLVHVVPNVGRRFHYTTNCSITRNDLTNAAGELLTYYSYSPPYQPELKKHPLVMGILGTEETGFDWNMNHEAFANCGAYFVYLDRQHRDYSQWTEDLLSVYQFLAQNTDIDTNRVYLFAVSGGAQAIYPLLEKRPELWQGAILYSPGGVPNWVNVPRVRFFIDTGEKDQDGGAVAAFQDQAAKAGAPVTVLIHPGWGHSIELRSVERERLRESLIFLSER